MRSVFFVPGVLFAMGCGKPPAAVDAGTTATAPTTATTATNVTTAAPPPTSAATAATPDAGAATAPDTAAAAPRYYLLSVLLGPVPVKMLVTARGTDATLDIPAQHLKDGPLSDVTLTDSEVKFTLKLPPTPEDAWSRFEAKRDGATGPWKGVVTQRGQGFPLTVVVADGPEALIAKRPQTPKPPFPYKTEDVSIAVGEGAQAVKLGGTLVLPGGPGPDGAELKGPFPAVVFISGSGAQDRDETIFDHKPFALLADALARVGVASLRTDDRGVGESTGKLDDATYEDSKADVVAQVAFLAGRPEIDKRKIGLIGHSEGGVIAPHVAVDKTSGVAFVVTLAGPATTGRAIIRQQNLDGLLTQGVTKEQAAPILDAVDALFAALDANAPAEELDKKAQAVADASATVGKSFGQTIPEAGIKAMVAQMKNYAKSPRLMAWVRANPMPDLLALNVPFVAFYGDKDTQVPAAIHAAALGEAFAKEGHGKPTIVVVPDANHLFQHATTGQVPEYAEIEETMVPATLQQIVEWIRKVAATL